MRRSLRSFCLIFTFVFLLVSATAGCTLTLKNATPPADTANKPDTGPVSIPGVDLSTPVKITGYLLGSPLPGTPAVMSELNKMLKRDLNAEMEINYISWGDVQSKYPLILAAGEDVDWVFTASWAFYSQLAGKGAFMELSEEQLQKYMPRHYELLRNTSALNEARINGSIYIIPTSTPDQKANVFIYREDLRKKYGLPEIKKFSDLEPFLKAVRDNEPDMIPLALGSNYDIQTPHMNLVTEKFDFVSDIMQTSSGGSGIVYCPLQNDGRLYYMSDEPIASLYKDAAYTLKSWYDKGYINKNAFADKVRSKEAFVQGKSAVGLGNSLDIQGNISDAQAEGFEVSIVPIVSGKTGRVVEDSYIGNGVSLARNTKQYERTLMALDFIMEDRAYDMLVYFGIKGRNYIEKDGKVVLLKDSAESKDSYPPDQAGFWFTNKNLFPPLSSWLPSYIDMQEQIKKKLSPNIYAAFVPSTDNIKVELTNCNQIITQYLNPIQLGTVKDVDSAFKTLDEKLKSAGIDRVMAEMQRQTRTFLKK